MGSKQVFDHLGLLNLLGACSPGENKQHASHSGKKEALQIVSDLKIPAQKSDACLRLKARACTCKGSVPPTRKSTKDEHVR
eukprot:1157340-Pelagomonas_calceolata.AAC.12